MQFNLFINNILEFLHSINVHVPRIFNRYINILLDADNMVLMAFSQVGLRRLMRKFSAYLVLLNKIKSKVVVLREG